MVIKPKNVINTKIRDQGYLQMQLIEYEEENIYDTILYRYFGFDSPALYRKTMLRQW